MLTLVMAGEAIFALPFHVARFFRPTLLAVFELSNTELGAMQGAYGVVAMLSYFPGGALADRFPVRKLLVGSLLSTAVSGLYFATLPSLAGLWALHLYWGCTTILLFWGALIRTAREWGTSSTQSSTYGLLDGGRGLLAALAATVGVLLISGSDPSGWTMGDRESALQQVILFYSGLTTAVAALVWFSIRERPSENVGTAEPATSRDKFRLDEVRDVLRRPAVWLSGAIILCAYTTYKGIDNYSLYAIHGYRMDEVEAAWVATLSVWVRPFAAILAGVLGDKSSASKISCACFTGLAALYLYFGLVTPSGDSIAPLLAMVLTTSALVYAVRGIYFALIEEGAIPVAVTGTAVGLTSLIGFTPDVFFPPLGGLLLDSSPGLPGLQHYFLVLAGFAAAGTIACAAFWRVVPQSRSLRTD
jgi:sugar phosphate permease